MVALDDEVRTAPRAFLTSLAATASNPLTIALWAGAFAAGGAATRVHSGEEVAALLVGIALGSLGWFSLLSAAVSLGRRWLRPGVLRTADVCAGVGLIGFGGVLGYRTLHDGSPQAPS